MPLHNEIVSYVNKYGFYSCVIWLLLFDLLFDQAKDYVEWVYGTTLTINPSDWHGLMERYR